MKNFIFHIMSFRALVSLLAERIPLLCKNCVFGCEVSQAGMDNQSALLCPLSSVRFILGPGAALAAKELAFIRAEMGWCHCPALGSVCCGLLCPGKAKPFFSAGWVLAQPVMSLIFSLVNCGILHLLSSPITPSHLLPQMCSFGFSNHWNLHNRLGVLVNGDLDIKLQVGNTGTESESPDTLNQIPKGFAPQTTEDKAVK